MLLYFHLLNENIKKTRKKIKTLELLLKGANKIGTRAIGSKVGTNLLCRIVLCITL